MTAKSVIEIDVQDQAFKDFSALFQKYQVGLAKMPAGWGKIKTATSSSANEFTKVAASLRAAATSMDAIAASQEKTRKSASATVNIFSGLARTTGTIARNVANTTASLVKWGLFGGLVGGIGSAFGLDKLAGSATNARRQSQGLGISSGELRAAEVNYHNFLDVVPTLSRIADTQSDLSKQWALTSIGVSASDLKSKNPAQLLPEILPKMVDIFKQGGGTQQYAEARGLTNIVDVETLRRLSRLSPEELAKASQSYARDVTGLGNSDDTLRNMADLNTQLSRAGQKIEAVFINGLAPLAPKFGELAESVAKMIGTFLASPKLKDWIDGFGKGLEKTAAYLESAEFQKSIQTFMSAIGILANGVVKIASWFGGGTPAEKAPEDTSKTNVKKWWGGAYTKKETDQFLGDIEKRNNLPPGLLDKVWSAESNRSDPKFMHSSAGAVGPFQFLPKTAAAYGVKDPLDFQDAATGAGKMYAQLLKQYGGDVEKALAGYNFGSGNLNKVLAQYGGDWKAHIPKETQGYVAKISAGLNPKMQPSSSTTTINIADATGGSAIISASTLAH